MLAGELKETITQNTTETTDFLFLSHPTPAPSRPVFGYLLGSSEKLPEASICTLVSDKSGSRRGPLFLVHREGKGAGSFGSE